MRSETAYFAGYVGTGFVGFSIDVGILLLLLSWGVEPIPARVVSIAVSIVCTWLINRRLVFRTTSHSAGTEYLRHLTIQLLGATLNFSVYAYLLNHYAERVPHPALALVAGSIVALSITYVGSRFWVYAPDNAR